MNFIETKGLMKIIRTAIIPAALIVLLCTTLLTAEGDIGTICQARCSGFTGQIWAQCLETCIRTMKKHDKGKEKKVSERMNECEEICSVYKGVENVKCLRLCMERNKSK